MHLKLSSTKWRPFCPGGDELSNFEISHRVWHSFSWAVIAAVCENTIEDGFQLDLLYDTVPQSVQLLTIDVLTMQWVATES